MSIKKIKEMMEHPSGKEFHKKYGLPEGIKNHPFKNRAQDDALKNKMEPHLSDKLRKAGYSRHASQKIATDKANHVKKLSDFHKKLHE